jgi:hypothetical protein
MPYIRSFNRFILISLALLGLSVSPANAALMSVNDAVFGNGSVTRDDVSELEWLDLTLTTSRSYNDLSDKFDSGEEFAGWRYASAAEVEQFFTGAGGGPGPFEGSQGTDVDWIETLLGLWGVTSSSSSESSFALTDTVNPFFGDLVVSLLIDNPVGRTDFASVNGTRYGRDITIDLLGSALVRSSPGVVPVPAAVWLFGTALIGLVGFNKRKQSA